MLQPWQVVLQATVDMRIEANDRIVRGMKQNKPQLFNDGLALMERGKRIAAATRRS